MVMMIVVMITVSVLESSGHHASIAVRDRGITFAVTDR
jgi:hypothetical protein